MKLIVLLIALTFVGCAAPLSPEQQAERQVRWSRVATSALDAGLKVGTQMLDSSYRRQK